MELRLAPLASIFGLNTDLLRNCLDGLSDDEMVTRVDGITNHAAYITAHLVGARAYLAGALGGDGTDPFEDRLGGPLTIDDIAEFPSREELLQAWEDVTRNLDRALASVADTRLDEDAPLKLPVDAPTLLGMVAFLAQHDSYHIGQLALLRKHLGHGAMSYERGGERS